MVSKTKVNNNTIYSNILSLYFKDPLAITEILKSEVFRSGVSLSNTVFEEIHLFNSSEKKSIISRR